MLKKIFLRNKNEIDTNLEKNFKKKLEAEKTIIVEKEKKLDFKNQQALSIGLDIKEDVRRISKSFFNNKNKKRSSAYKEFKHYLLNFDKNEKMKIQKLGYIEFKEKENQIYTTLKNGFAQLLSKGSPLNDQNTKTINFIFNDIKKLPSKGHRYWYYTLYIWQRIEE
ncbi:MAG: hypothetical protein GY932_06375 [Arcobacter sp.]|nr:hypothetical protein [Arcobacter sp.]